MINSCRKKLYLNSDHLHGRTVPLIPEQWPRRLSRPVSSPIACPSPTSSPQSVTVPPETSLRLARMPPARPSVILRGTKPTGAGQNRPVRDQHRTSGGLKGSRRRRVPYPMGWNRGMREIQMTNLRLDARLQCERTTVQMPRASVIRTHFERLP